MEFNSSENFDQIDQGTAWVVHTKNGTKLRPDESPVLFIAGEQSKYKFILRSAYVTVGGNLNILLMSVNEMVTPEFTMVIRVLDFINKVKFEKNVIVCAHGSSISTGQHLHTEIKIPYPVTLNANTLSLKIDITGSPVSFRVWTNDMKSITLAGEHSELSLPFKSLSLHK